MAGARGWPCSRATRLERSFVKHRGQEEEEEEKEREEEEEEERGDAAGAVTGKL